MRITTGKVLIALFLSLSALTNSHATEPVTTKLTEKLSKLLQEEMRSVQAAMMTIHSAMIMGQHDTVATNAQQIHESFILQRELTESDRQDLMSAVPDGFIKLDKMFHQLASSLAESGRGKNTKEQHKLFNEMTETCIRCHGTYVFDRFPGVNAW